MEITCTTRRMSSTNENIANQLTIKKNKCWKNSIKRWNRRRKWCFLIVRLVHSNFILTDSQKIHSGASNGQTSDSQIIEFSHFTTHWLSFSFMFHCCSSISIPNVIMPVLLFIFIQIKYTFINFARNVSEIHHLALPNPTKPTWHFYLFSNYT